jgi:probable HAF family extracellular repeat protein
MQDLVTLGGRSSAACGINNRGQVAGYSNTAGPGIHAFVWEADTGMQDLGMLAAYGLNAQRPNRGRYRRGRRTRRPVGAR